MPKPGIDPKISWYFVFVFFLYSLSLFSHIRFGSFGYLFCVQSSIPFHSLGFLPFSHRFVMWRTFFSSFLLPPLSGYRFMDIRDDADHHIPGFVSVR